MRRFTFRLDTLLELRRRREDEVKRELGRKNGEIAAAEAEKRSLQQEFVALQSSERERRMRSLDVLHLRASVVYRHKLKHDIIAKGEQIGKLGVEAAAIRKRLTKATQARRALELLREHRLEAWRKESNREQQIFSDDVSQQRYIRRRAAEALSSGTPEPGPRRGPAHVAVTPGMVA